MSDRREMPSFEGATAWLHTSPLTPGDLAGRVVAVQFWTFTCINWLRTLPYIRAWHEHYQSHGLVVIGVHTPEFEVEHDVDEIRREARDRRVDYPIAVDNDYEVWRAFENQYWPALYLVDAEGRIRHHQFGEGGYEESEQFIRRLLADAGAAVPGALARVEPNGIEVAADWDDLRSPETYVGYARSSGFASPEVTAFDAPRIYTAPSRLDVNEWALSGEWTVAREAALSRQVNGSIEYEFHARDLHLILVPPAEGEARFRVRLDGQPPGGAHGLDVDDAGNGVVTAPRLHQLIRQHDRIADRHFEIEFLDPGASALCFTFG